MLFSDPEAAGLRITSSIGFVPHSGTCHTFSIGLAHLNFELKILADEIRAALRALGSAGTPAQRQPFARRLLALTLQLAELRGELNAWTASYEMSCPECRAQRQASGRPRSWPMPEVAGLERDCAVALGLPATPPTTQEARRPGASTWLGVLAAELDRATADTLTD